MNLIKSERKGNRFFLEIEVPYSHLISMSDQAFHKLSKSSKIPGFRPGKAPRNVFEKFYGREVIIREAIMDSVNDAYSKTVENLNLQVIDYPQNLKIGEYKENEPVSFTCEVDVLPEVTLGKYKGLSVKKESVAVGEKEVQEQIDKLRNSYVEFISEEKNAQSGDIIIANIKASVNSVPYEKWTRLSAGIEVGNSPYGSDFDIQITGQKKGDSLSFNIDYPQSNENQDVAGQTVQFELEVLEVRSRKLPELDDAFVSKVSPSKTVEEFRKELEASLIKKAEEEVNIKFESDLLDAILSTTPIEVPSLLIDRESELLVQQFEDSIRQSGLNLETYLSFVRKTVDEFKAEQRPVAEKKVKTHLMLDAVAKTEKIEVLENELVEEIKKWNLPNLKEDAEITEKIKTMDLSEMRLALGRRKTMDFIISETKTA